MDRRLFITSIAPLSALVLATASPALAQQPTSGFIQVDSSRLYYEECGRGSAIVLLHDGLLHSVTWDDVWTPLCQRYHVIRYDRRGMGHSSAPKIPFIPTEDLTALLQHLNVARATLVGMSSGSALALDFAIRHPDKVEKLLLIGPVVHGMASSAQFNERGARNNAPLAQGDIATTARNWANDPWQIAGAHLEARRKVEQALAANPQNLRYTNNLELRFAVPAAARLGEIHVPTVLLVGESDIPDVQAYAGAVELGAWGAVRKVVKDAGHLIPLEQPARVVREISDLVDRPVVALSDSVLLRRAGQYAPIYGRPADVLVKDGRLVLHMATERDLPLFPTTDSTFFALVWGGVTATFHHDSLSLVVGTDTQIAGRVHPAPPKGNG